MTPKERGDKIRLMRESRNMTQEQLAIAIGVSPSTIGMYEAGRRRPKGIRAEALADVFNVPIWSFDYNENEMAPIISSTEEEFSNETDAQPNVQPDLEKAAFKAIQILDRYKVSSAPIIPMMILKSMPNVFIVTFTEFAAASGVDNNSLVAMYDSESQDVVTFVKEIDGRRRYIIAYNQRMPYYMIHRAMARELGHILLGHDRTQANDAQTTEALYFMRHLLCPRPLVKALQDRGVNLTVETIGNVTGLYGRSIAGMRETPGAHIEAKKNRKIREQFSGYVDSVVDYYSLMASKTDVTPADFGTYMDNYEE